jgi:hypothetical protein
LRRSITTWAARTKCLVSELVFKSTHWIKGVGMGQCGPVLCGKFPCRKKKTKKRKNEKTPQKTKIKNRKKPGKKPRKKQNKTVTHGTETHTQKHLSAFIFDCTVQCRCQIHIFPIESKIRRFETIIPAIRARLPCICFGRGQRDSLFFFFLILFYYYLTSSAHRPPECSRCAPRPW